MADNTKKIAIVIIAHNQGRYLDATLNSVKEQTIGLKNIEVILVDDSSDDETSHIIQKFKEENPEETKTKRVTFKNVGRTRNTAVEMVTTPFMIFLDGDDILNKEACEFLLKISKEYGCDFVISKLKNFYSSQPDNSQEKAKLNNIELLTKHNAISQLLYHKKYMGHLTGCLLKSDSMKKNPFRPISCYEDLDLTPSIIMSSNNIAYAPSPIYFYRQNKNSTSKNIDDTKAATMVEILDKLKNLPKGIKQQHYYFSLCVKQSSVLLDNTKNISDTTITSIYNLLKKIPIFLFILSPYVRISRKRLIIQIILGKNAKKYS
ncbi:glycosyltransferase family 2 protein [Aquitalea sp. S1-19]|nr:glycosyltransferase family 2 protein [Aquitalea sp. S1-19]